MAGEPGVDEVGFAYVSASLCYLRLMPTSLPSPLSLARLRSVAHLAPVLKRTGNALTSINQYGAIAYEPGRMPPGANAHIKASTQLFPTGEMWAINGELISRDERRPVGPKLPPLVFEKAYYDALRAILNFATKSLDLTPPWQIECGIVGIKGLNIIMSDPAGGWIPWGPVRALDRIVHRAVLNSTGDDLLNELLLKFFADVFDATSYARPDQLFHFPPGPPRYP
jgi:hypothetical protein